MKNTSFKKGENFEKFVEEQLFSQKDYVLVHRTNNFEQNKDRYAENTLFPDFKFRCKKTLEEFYVEAKFRSNFNSKKQIEIMSEAQFDRFNSIEYKEVKPIYLAIGLGGDSTFPKQISFIPLKEIKSPKLSENFVKDYYIKTRTIDTNELKLNEYFNFQNQKKEKELKPKKSNLPKKIILPIIAILIVLFGAFNIENIQSSIKPIINKKPEPKLIKSKATSEYYDLFEYGTTVEGTVKNYGETGYVIIKVAVNQGEKEYNQSKKIYLEKNKSENFIMYFYEIELLKKDPTVRIKVLGVNN